MRKKCEDREALQNVFNLLRFESTFGRLVTKLHLLSLFELFQL